MRSSDSRLDVLDAPATTNANHLQPFDGNTLAAALRLHPGSLWFFVLKAYALYTTHQIRKKSGKMRTLHIPDERLMRVQRKVLRAFLNRVEYPPWVAAYVPGRTTVDAARIHAGRPVLIVVDLENFFPSTKRAWVRDAFAAEFAISRPTAEMLATLVTAPWVPGKNAQFVVPQGAPTSGAAANIVAMHRLDPLILEVCEDFGMDYTRYADDLAFSRTQPLSRDHASAFIYAIVRAIRRSGYRVNYEKIRVQRQGQQQRLLGLTINDHPNLPKRVYRGMRALVHQCATQGYEETAKLRGFECGGALEIHLQGMFAYAEPLAPQRVRALRARLSGGAEALPETPDC
jgi:RNA-directed DNA polymerase